MIGIYKITNLINGKVYIGQSVNIENRWKAHQTRPFQDNKEKNSLLYTAIRKYGLESFVFEVIEECEKEKLNEQEKYWIDFFQSNDIEKGYNATAGGGSNVTKIKLSDEQILEIYKLLQNTQLTQSEIAKQYGLNQSYVSYINQGTYRVQKGWSFPIRPMYFDQQLKHNEATRCPICGNKKDKTAKICLNCYNKSRGSHLPSREELKNMIRKESFVQIGKNFGVSDNAVKKWCDKYNLPRRKKDIKQYTDEEWEKI